MITILKSLLFSPKTVTIALYGCEMWSVIWENRTYRSFSKQSAQGSKRAEEELNK